MGRKASSSKPGKAPGRQPQTAGGRAAAKVSAAWAPFADMSYLPPDQSLAYMVREVHRAYMRSLVARIGKFGITSGMWWFLRILWTKDGLSQAELSKKLAVKGPTTVRAMDRLQDFGLITRRVHPEDKRLALIYLTPEGHRLRDTLMPLAIETNRIGIQSLTRKEEEMARSLLGRVLESLAEDQLASDPGLLEEAGPGRRGRRKTVTA